MATNSPDAIDIRDLMVWSTWHRNVHHVSNPTTPRAMTACGLHIRKPKSFVKTELRNVSCNECRKLMEVAATTDATRIGCAEIRCSDE